MKRLTFITIYFQENVLKSTTASKQDYLEAILTIKNSRGEVRPIDISNELAVSRASVTKALKNLSEAGLVIHKKYGSVELTEEGHGIALNVLTTHNTLKAFLIEVLKIDGETAEEDACRMEHVISERTLNAFIEYLREH